MLLPLAILASISIGGNFVQGGLVKIEAPAGTQIIHDGQEVEGFDGIYYIGFGRNAPANTKLVVKYPDGESEAIKRPVIQRQYDLQRVNGVDEAKAAPNAESKKQINQDALDIGVARMTANYPCPKNLKFSKPRDSLVTGLFGSARIYNGHQGKPHSGIDFKGDIGDPVYAPEAGRVIFTKHLLMGGNTLALDHGCGIVSTFMHLNGYAKKKGDVVKKGDLIGYVGKTGLATAPHLHWSLNLGRTRLDPLLVLE